MDVCAPSLPLLAMRIARLLPLFFRQYRTANVLVYSRTDTLISLAPLASSTHSRALKQRVRRKRECCARRVILLSLVAARTHLKKRETRASVSANFSYARMKASVACCALIKPFDISADLLVPFPLLLCSRLIKRQSTRERERKRVSNGALSDH